MARTHTKQYNPISSRETSVNDGLSVRTARDHGWNANNYKYHAGNHKLFGELWYPYVATLDNTTLNLLLYLGKWRVPPGFSVVRWWLNGRRKSGTDRADFHLVAASNLYVGPECVFDETLLWDAASGIIRVDTDHWRRKDATLALDRPGFDGFHYFYLAAENDAGGTDGTTRAEIVSVDCQPVLT